jgi:hypothetical protein
MTTKIHMIGFMAGLTSSILWRVNPYSRWARKLQARIANEEELGELLANARVRLDDAAAR